MRLLTPVLLALLITTPVMAQQQNNDMQSLMGRMDQIQRQMDTISRQVYKGQTPPPGAMSGVTPDNANMAAAMDERMAGIEGSVKQLANRLDEQDYAFGQLKQQFDLFKSDVEMQLKDLSTKAAAAAPAAASSGESAAATPAEKPAAKTADTSVDAKATADTEAASGDAEDLPTDSAASMYDAAFQALREQKYPRAEAGFKEFLKKYGNDALAGNAQYWLGETYYARGNYAEAAKVFATGYQKFPKSSKAPDNLLKLGLSLSQSGKKKEACVTLQQLGIQYNNAAAVIKQRAEDERKKLGCDGSAPAAG